MGEIADMMMEGTLCAGCGVYIGCDDMGTPMYCDAECMADHEKVDKNRICDKSEE